MSNINNFLETFCSRKYIKQLIKIEVEESNSYLTSIYQGILRWLISYENGEIGKRYASKDLRLAIFKNNEELINNCAVAILYSTIIMKSNRFQELISLTSSQVRLCEDEWDNVRTVAEMLAGCNGIVYNIIQPILGSSDYYTIEKLVDLPEEVINKLSLGIYLPPATYLPDAWSNHYNGGYELSKESCILGDYFNNHNETLNLKVLNTLQNVSYELTEIVDTPEVTDLTGDALDQFNARQPLTREIYEAYKNRPFYFVWQYDKRGRLYNKGYDITIQGNEYHKASLRFSHKEKLTPRGIYWLKVDLANTYGKDKLPLDERVSFIDKNIDDMLSNKDKWISNADEPLLFQLALNSYEKGVIHNEPIGHITRLDATCSGPQILSTIMRDEKAMKLFNVLGEDRNDYYSIIAKEIQTKCPNSKIFGDDWNKIRKAIKPAVMTFYYNSLKNPKDLLGGENSAEYRAFITAMHTYTAGALELMKDVNSCFSPIALFHSWYMPDNHYAYCPVTKVVDKRIELHELGKNIKITYRYISNEPNKDEWRSLMPNLTHSIDGWIVREIATKLSYKDIELSPIHDSFGVHPNYCDELRKQYRRCLSKLYRENIIDDILSQIVDEKVEILRPIYNPLVDKEILTNENGCYIC